MAKATAAHRGGRNLFVISVDPAPGKKSTIFDGNEFLRRTGPELRADLHDLRDRTPQTLLCWDAPLTGPADPRSAGTQRRDFTQRSIERFFMRKNGSALLPDGGLPAGISVRPYSELQHWTITKSLLGLPRTGCYDQDFEQLPFRLLPAPDDEQNNRPSVVEVHPAVAAWLWCKDCRGNESIWRYKDNRYEGRDAVRNEMWQIILESIPERMQCKLANRCTPTNGDEFDAAVGYILGALYVQGNAGVAILGDRHTGSFLLPVDSNLKKEWCEFLARKR